MSDVLFRIGLIAVRWVDVVDILLVATVVYYLWKLSRHTRAARMWLGIGLLLALGMLARLLSLRALSWMLASLSAFWAIAFVILFQPELRRALSDIGSGWSGRRRALPRLPELLSRTCGELSARRWGALIVLTRRNTVAHLVDTGITLHSDISSELLVTLFAPNTPLHDGAAIIAGDSVIAAKCLLPLTAEAGEGLGTRHRAALTTTQDTDAIVIAVSEENGGVSIAADGAWHLFRGESSEVAAVLTRLLGLDGGDRKKAKQQ